MATSAGRSRTQQLTKEQWDQLLDWLGPDPDSAAARYESLRRRLIKVLMSRGSTIPEELADEAINIVAAKLNDIRSTYSGNPELYFLGVARKVLLESRREITSRDVVPLTLPSTADIEGKHACLEKCLNELEPNARTLVLSYYQETRQAKIDHRKRLAAQFGIAPNALRIKTCRLREALRKCVEDCWQRFVNSSA